MIRAVLLYRGIRWGSSNGDFICPEIGEVVIVGGMDRNSFYVIGFIKYDVPCFKNGVSSRYPNFVGFRVIKIAYKYSFNGFVLAFSSYCLGNESPALASIGA